MSDPSKSETTGHRDALGYLRWTPTSCGRCGYERADCTCTGSFVEQRGPDRTTKAVWRAECGVDGSRWVATMKNDSDPCVMSFCPDCQSRGMAAPGVLNWKLDRTTAGDMEYQSWE